MRLATSRLVSQFIVQIVNDPATASAPSRPFQVLILEPEVKLSAEIVSALKEAVPGTTHAIARSVGEAQQLVMGKKPDLFVLDVDADYDRAQEFIYDLRTSHPDARAIILTANHFTAQRQQVAGLGAIHFLEKPFPRGDFIALAEALLSPAGRAEGERFQGTLSDLHIADIIQLKCISGSTSMLEFTGPRGEKARVYFENGQVRHAIGPGKEGRDAFNEIVDWKGGVISEVPVPENLPRTITLDWQVLLMEAVRKMDETRDAKPAPAATAPAASRKVLVIDDSLMLLSFVKEILGEQHYRVTTAPTAQEGLRACRAETPDLILLDYVLPDLKGDEVCRQLVADPLTSKIPVVYMSGYGSDLQPDQKETPNVIGSLSKPFTSESLINAMEKYLPPSVPADAKSPGATAAAPVAQPPATEEKKTPVPVLASLGKSENKAPNAVIANPNPLAKPENKPVDVPPSSPIAKPITPTASPVIPPVEKPVRPIVGIEKKAEPAPIAKPAEKISGLPNELPRKSETPVRPPPSSILPSSIVAKIPVANAQKENAKAANAYFCGDSSFFSLHWALQTIAREKLTGILRAFWTRESVELLAREGKVVLVTTRAPALYCEEAPVTLLNVENIRVEAARTRQAETGCPLFVTLANEGLILRDPGLQLVQHYGQKLFAQLWPVERVRFVFEEQPLPDYARDISPMEENIDQWALSTLRFVQYGELGNKAGADQTCVPAYTRDGYERVQQLRLTDAEAQFASQFNGSRSMTQISKNLRLDIKFARLSLFRFLALEIVECWPAQIMQRTETRGRRGFFTR